MAGVFYCSGVGITEQQLAAMQGRLADNIRDSPALSSASAGPQIILGIDPALRGTGYGVIDTTKNTPDTLAQGTIKCPANWPMSRCFLEISKALETVSLNRP